MKASSSTSFNNFFFFFTFFSLPDSDSLVMPPPIEQQLHLTPPTIAKSEILCNNQEQDRYLPDEGIDSSLTVLLRPGRTVNSCKRYFVAPNSSGLFIRLVRNENNSTESRRNLTDLCPLSIVSIFLRWLNLSNFDNVMFFKFSCFYFICKLTIFYLSH